MKPEEAYNLIELCLDYDKDMSEYPERYEMALRIAREVFQKHTPVRPVYDHRYAEMCCAYCGNQVSGWEESPDYCPQCGQAIDWEDAIKQKLTTDAMDYLNQNMKQPFIEKGGEWSDV